MVVDINEVETKTPIFTDAKPSDWIEQQPVERFCSGEMRDEKSRMCGVGMIADFYGFRWSETSNDIKCDFFATEKTGSFFPVFRFDDIFERMGPEAAKYFTIEWLRERGL